jgi:hypothetical protein
MNPDNHNRILVTYECIACKRRTFQPTPCTCGECRFVPVGTLTTPVRIEHVRKIRKVRKPAKKTAAKG